MPSLRLIASNPRIEPVLLSTPNHRVSHCSNPLYLRLLTALPLALRFNFKSCWPRGLATAFVYVRYSFREQSKNRYCRYSKYLSNRFLAEFSSTTLDVFFFFFTIFFTISFQYSDIFNIFRKKNIPVSVRMRKLASAF